MPWRVPVYDSFVRSAPGVPASWDHPEAYRKVSFEVFAMARAMTGDCAWAGSLEPASPLRALDKLTWWLGGGSAGAAAEVRDPWQVIRKLGLKCPWPALFLRSHGNRAGTRALRCIRRGKSVTGCMHPDPVRRAGSADLGDSCYWWDTLAVRAEPGDLCARSRRANARSYR